MTHARRQGGDLALCSPQIVLPPLLSPKTSFSSNPRSCRPIWGCRIRCNHRLVLLTHSGNFRGQENQLFLKKSHILVKFRNKSSKRFNFTKIRLFWNKKLIFLASKTSGMCQEHKPMSASYSTNPNQSTTTRV